MCGLSGFLSGESSWVGLTGVNKFMEQAAEVGKLRGEDSTGMFQVKKDKSVNVHKLALPGDVFASTKQAQKLFSTTDSTVCTIMHHRAATRGAVNYDNAHPFEHSDSDRYLVGAHNGSLNNWKTKHDGINFDVDSDYALYRIFQEGEKAFSSLNGAYTFVWWESDGKLRIVCNGERPFAFAFIHKKNAMLMASEAGMLWWLAARNGIEIDEILSPEAHQLLTFDPAGSLRKFTSTQVEKASAYTSVYTGGNSAGTHGNFTQRQGANAIPPATRAPAKAASGTGTSSRSGSLLYELGLRVGDEVEFFPLPELCTNLQLVGEVLVEPPGGKTLEVVPALISNLPSHLYNNVKAGSIKSIHAKIRTETTLIDKGKATTPALVLGEICLTVGEAAEEDEVGAVATLVGPRNERMSYDDFKLAVKDGCACCTDNVSIQDGILGNIGWTPDSQPICTKCLKTLEGAAHAV